jgi:AraC-like DNA-binding protein
MTIHMITGASLTGIPEAARNELGSLAVQRALRTSGLTASVLDMENAFIPELALVNFLDSLARQSGWEHLGLALAGNLTFARYGTWGRYVLEGDTLGESLARFHAAIGMHASYATLRVDVDQDFAWIRYRFAEAARTSYVNVALCGVGILVDYVRRYTRPDWVPEVIELDIPRPPKTTDIEDAFRCRLRFGAPQLGVGFDPALLRSSRCAPMPEKLISLADVSRARLCGPPSDLEGIVRELVRAQVRSGTVSLDAASSALGYGVRRLQRALDRGGLSFREIVRSVRLETAKELITQTSMPISTIGAELGYSAKSHFSRAFSRDAGCTPGEYRVRYRKLFP